MEASLQPLVNSGKDGGVANVGTRIFEMTPDPLQAGIPPSQGPALLSRGPYLAITSSPFWKSSVDQMKFISAAGFFSAVNHHLTL